MTIRFDLNAVELACAKMKGHIKTTNVPADLSLKPLQIMTREAAIAIFIFRKEDWNSYCNHVQWQEQEYWKKDGVVEEGMDKLIIQVEEYNNGSSSSHFKNETDSNHTDSEKLD